MSSTNTLTVVTYFFFYCVLFSPSSFGQNDSRWNQNDSSWNYISDMNRILLVEYDFSQPQNLEMSSIPHLVKDKRPNAKYMYKQGKLKNSYKEEKLFLDGGGHYHPSNLDIYAYPTEGLKDEWLMVVGDFEICVEGLRFESKKEMKIGLTWGSELEDLTYNYFLVDNAGSIHIGNGLFFRANVIQLPLDKIEDGFDLQVRRIDYNYFFYVNKELVYTYRKEDYKITSLGNFFSIYLDPESSKNGKMSVEKLYVNKILNDINISEEEILILFANRPDYVASVFHDQPSYTNSTGGKSWWVGKVDNLGKPIGRGTLYEIRHGQATRQYSIYKGELNDKLRSGLGTSWTYTSYGGYQTDFLYKTVSNWKNDKVNGETVIELFDSFKYQGQYAKFLSFSNISSYGESKGAVFDSDFDRVNNLDVYFSHKSGFRYSPSKKKNRNTAKNSFNTIFGIAVGAAILNELFNDNSQPGKSYSNSPCPPGYCYVKGPFASKGYVCIPPGQRAADPRMPGNEICCDCK